MFYEVCIKDLRQNEIVSYIEGTYGEVGICVYRYGTQETYGSLGDIIAYFVKVRDVLEDSYLGNTADGIGFDSSDYANWDIDSISENLNISKRKAKNIIQIVSQCADSEFIVLDDLNLVIDIFYPESGYVFSETSVLPETAGYYEVVEIMSKKLREIDIDIISRLITSRCIMICCHDTNGAVHGKVVVLPKNIYARHSDFVYFDNTMHDYAIDFKKLRKIIKFEDINEENTCVYNSSEHASLDDGYIYNEKIGTEYFNYGGKRKKL